MSCLFISVIGILDNYTCGPEVYIGYGGHCYQTSASSSSYTMVQAQWICAGQGGYIVEIDTQGEQDFVDGKGPIIIYH